MPAATPDPHQAGLAAAIDRLAARLREVTGAEVAVAAADTAPSGDEGLRLSTIALAPLPYANSAQQRRINATLLVEATGADHAAASDLLATAMLQVMADGSWDVVPAPEPGLWQSLGRPARPAFQVVVPLALAIERRPAPPVRHPLEIRGAGLRSVSGRVLAADGTPLAGAIIRQQGTGRPVTAAYDGSWSLRLPTTPVTLEITARGAAATYRLGQATGTELTQTGVDITMTQVGTTPTPAPTPTA